MSDLSECVPLGFTTRPTPDDVAKHDLEFAFWKAGKADPTRTQVLLRLKSPVLRPEWFKKGQDKRCCWKNKTKLLGRLYNISLVLDPPNPECRIVSVSQRRAQ